MRFLVLTHLFGEFTGSEINALQLCMGLKEAGHQADIGSFQLRGPLIGMAQQSGIEVHDLLQDHGPSLDYDVIWAHHAPVLTHLLFRRTLSPCRIVFSSLSPITPLESPPTYHGELPWILAHSPCNIKHLKEMLIPEERIHYFPNFAPKDFFDNPRPPSSNGLLRIAIVSNHQPEEVLQMVALARADGLHVDIIGKDNPVFVDSTVLPLYDSVLTIGKTVQYGFAQRVPVYCYDHFGGPGYIDEDNFELVQHGNFCGRTHWSKLTGEELYADVRARYDTASGNERLEFLYQKAVNSFSLEKNLGEVISLIETTPVMDIEGLRRRNIAAGRLNDAYMVSLRHRLYLDAKVHELSQPKIVPPKEPTRRRWLSQLYVET